MTRGHRGAPFLEVRIAGQPHRAESQAVDRRGSPDGHVPCGVASAGGGDELTPDRLPTRGPRRRHTPHSHGHGRESLNAWCTAGRVKADLPARKNASFAGVTGTGSGGTRLIILRGNSASGQSSTAAEIRRRHGRRDLAVVGQDNLRRDVLREHDVPAGANTGLIDLVTRYALNHGFNVIVMGATADDGVIPAVSWCRARHPWLFSLSDPKVRPGR